MTGTPSDVHPLFTAAAPAPERRVHVDGARGDDTRDGSTPATALRTIPSALEGARPGDRILVAPGRHPPFSVIGVRGECDSWITIECADPQDRPIIDARNSASNGIEIRASEFIGLFGFEVQGAVDGPAPEASGIAVFHGSASIRIWACSVSDFPGGGIDCFWAEPVTAVGPVPTAGGWDRVELAHNRIAGCCRRSPYNTSGISFFGAEELGPALIDGFGYRAVQNTVVDCRCEVPYSLGGLPFVTDGNGISIDCLVKRNDLTPALPPYRKPGLVQSNTVLGNGGRGLHVLDSVRVVDRANTYAGNLTTESPAFADAAEVEVHLDASIDPAGAGIVHDGNIVLPRRGKRRYAGPPGTAENSGAV